MVGMRLGPVLLLFVVAVCMNNSSFAAGGEDVVDKADSIGILYQFDQILHDLRDTNSTLAAQTARKYLNILRLNTGETSNISISHSLGHDVISILGIKFLNETHFVKEKPVACNALEHLFLDYIVPARVNKPLKTNSLVIDAFNEYKLDGHRVLLTSSQKLWQLFCSKYREYKKIKVRIYKNMVSQASLVGANEISVLTTLSELQQLCNLQPNQSLYYLRESKLTKIDREKRSLLANHILPPAVNIVVK